MIDTFNRANGALGAAWVDQTGGFSIAGNTNDVGGGGSILWDAVYGADQEACVKLVAIDPNGAGDNEVGVQLKAQGTSLASGLISVVYRPSSQTIEVWTTTNGSDWQQHSSTSAAMQNGDVLGAKAKSNGDLEVYRNGALLGTYSVAGWPYSANGGRIGLWAQNSSGSVLDDFAGGASMAGRRPGGSKMLAKPLAKPAVFAHKPAPQPAPQAQSGGWCASRGWPANCTATSYYTFTGQRLAMRMQSEADPTGVVYGLHGDHLGSPNVATDANGNKVSELRYKPYGEVRYTNGSLPTDRTFTGQVNAGMGVMDFGARFYSPLLGRFISADSIVQAPGDPQTLNRYAFVRNNPLKYADPSGHCFGPAAVACLAGGAALLYILASQATLNHTYQGNPDVVEDTARAINSLLTTPLDAGPPVATTTAGQGPQVDASPALGYPLGPVQGAGTSEAYPLAGESSSIQLTTPLDGSATMQIAGPLLTKIRNSAGDAYPSIKDPRTGSNIEFPEGQLTRVSPADRVDWGPEERGAYIKEWYDRGFKTPKGGWDRYDIHHIKPREFGGTNDFDNLVPVDRSKHKQFNRFWERYP